MSNGQDIGKGAFGGFGAEWQSTKLTPDEATRKVITVANEVPQLSVLGIAGPGDPLANPGRT